MRNKQCKCVFVDNFLVLGLHNNFLFFLSLTLFHIPFIYFPFTLFVPHFASLVSLVFPCVIAFLRYLAYKYCCIPCFCIYYATEEGHS